MWTPPYAVAYRFTVDATVYFPEEERFQTHSERLYLLLPIEEITSERFASLPEHLYHRICDGHPPRRSDRTDLN